MPSITTRIRRTNVQGEYVVRLYVDGKLRPASDYFTDSLDDARHTAAAMERVGAAVGPARLCVGVASGLVVGG